MRRAAPASARSLKARVMNGLDQGVPQALEWGRMLFYHFQNGAERSTSRPSEGAAPGTATYAQGIEAGEQAGGGRAGGRAAGAADP